MDFIGSLSVRGPEPGGHLCCRPGLNGEAARIRGSVRSRVVPPIRVAPTLLTSQPRSDARPASLPAPRIRPAAHRGSPNSAGTTTQVPTGTIPWLAVELSSAVDIGVPRFAKHETAVKAAHACERRVRTLADRRDGVRSHAARTERAVSSGISVGDRARQLDGQPGEVAIHGPPTSRTARASCP